MYAKLVFTSGTTSGEAVRDIARLVDASSGGTADLSDLEFINSADSELVAGTNSGWSLHSSTSLGSGAISATDSHYILSGTTATSSKNKYCAIMVNGSFTSSSIYDSANVGVCLSPVLDPGTATEFFSAGYSGTSSANYDHNSLAPGTIYLFAEPRKLMMFGSTAAGQVICQGQFEAAETPNTTYRDLPPVLFAQWGKTTATSTASHNQSCAVRNDNFWAGTNVLDESLIQWVGSMYSDNVNLTGTVRSFGVYCGNPRTITSNEDDVYEQADIHMDDGTTNGSTDSISGLTRAFNNWYFPTVRTEMFGPGLSSSSNLDGTGSQWKGGWGVASMTTRDSSGNKALPLRPIVADFPLYCADIYNISDVCKIWWAPCSLGNAGDTITVGSDVYIYLPMTNRSGGAILVKRI